MNKCIDCYKTCGYFPNIELKLDEYFYDEKIHANRRKEPTQLKCLYDYTDLKWNKICPRTEKKNV